MTESKSVTFDDDTRREQIIDRYAAGLVDGTVFRQIAVSHRSVPLGGPPMHRGMYARILETLGRFAHMDDRMAYTVHRVLVRPINPYGTEYEALAKIADALADAASLPYFDAIGAAMPGAGRRSQYKIEPSERNGIWLALLMAEIEAALIDSAEARIGWCLRALIERDATLTLPKRYLPRIWEALL